MSDATRQHYKLATGSGLDSPPTGPKSKFAKGGKATVKRPFRPKGRGR